MGAMRGGVRATLVALFVAAFAACSTTPVRDPHPRVALDTSMGRIVVELDAERAPVTTDNFLAYVREGHYDGTIFHRVVADFVVQGGGHEPSMKERPTRPPIPNEARSAAAGGLSNRAGTIAMAREAAVDSATAQFFINVVDNVRLDHVDVPPEGITIQRSGQPLLVTQADAERVFGYAVFGRVVEGMEVVERMRRVPVRTIGEYQNVPVAPIVIEKATVLATRTST